MRLVDTNVFIHALVQPVGDLGATDHAACRALFDRVSEGAERVATTEACLIEVFRVLTNKQRFGLPSEKVLPLLRSLVMERGILVRGGDVYLSALDLFGRHTRLHLEDAILAAHALTTGWPILSYDRGFDRIASIVRVEPELVTR